MAYDSSEFKSRANVPIMQAAAMAQVSRRTIYNWLKSGRLDYFRTAGGSVRIYVDSLTMEKAESDKRMADYPQQNLKQDEAKGKADHPFLGEEL